MRCERNNGLTDACWHLHYVNCCSPLPRLLRQRRPGLPQTLYCSLRLPGCIALSRVSCCFTCSIRCSICATVMTSSLFAKLFPTFFHILFPSLLIRTSASAVQSRHAHGTIYGEISGTGSPRNPVGEGSLGKFPAPRRLWFYRVVLQ